MYVFMHVHTYIHTYIHTYVCVCVKRNLNEEHALGLQVETHAVPLVVKEVLQTQELHTAQGAPVPPVHCDLQLPGLQTFKSSSLLLSLTWVYW